MQENLPVSGWEKQKRQSKNGKNEDKKEKWTNMSKNEIEAKKKLCSISL